MVKTLFINYERGSNYIAIVTSASLLSSLQYLRAANKIAAAIHKLKNSQTDYLSLGKSELFTSSVSSTYSIHHYEQMVITS